MIAASMTVKLMGTAGAFFGGTFLLDPFSAYFKLAFYVACGLGILVSMKYLEIEDVHRGEYYALMLFATSGMMIMASAGDLITLYLGLELMALSVYVLAGFMRGDSRSNEAGIKYLLLGAFSSGIMLYGMSLLYGIAGTTNLNGILAFLRAADLGNPLLFLSVVMLIVSFGFKVAAVPFHMWVPDVYEGAPTSVTAFMSAGPKVAGFAVLLRVYSHVHLMATAIIGVGIVLSEATSINAVLARVDERVRQTPPGEWVFGYFITHLSDRGMPTRFDLDRVSTDHPIRLTHRNGHLCSMNIKALEALGVPKDLEGVEQEAGEVTGVVRDPAIQVLPHPGFSMSEERKREALKLAPYMAAQKGVTTLHALDGGKRKPGAIEYLQNVEKDLAVRLVLYNQTMEIKEVLDSDLSW